MKAKIFFNTLWLLLKALFSGKDATALIQSEFAQKYGIPAVDFVNRVKSIVNSPLIDVFTALTPYPDETIVSVVRVVLTNIATGLNFLNQSHIDAPNIALFIEKIAASVETLSPEMKASFYTLFARDIAKALSDGKLTNAEATALTQTIFATFKQQK